MALAGVGVCALAWAAYESGRRAWADHLHRGRTREAVERAARLEPGNASYQAWLGEMLEREGKDAEAVLRAVTAANPYDAESWMRLGLREEMEGEAGRAEEYLLRAARANKKYEPRWTLANYYFRRGEIEKFREWARKALEMSYGDRRALLELCWGAGPQGAEMLGGVKPERREAAMAVALFLAEKAAWGAAERLVREMGQSATKAESGFFLTMCDRLLEGGRWEGAVEVWNGLCGRGVIDRKGLDAGQERVVTNGDFSAGTLGRGFDWRIGETAGVYVMQRPAGAGWSVSFDGKQEERCEVIRQAVPLEAGRKYRVRYSFGVRGTAGEAEPGETGIRWKVRGEGGEALGESAGFAMGERREEHFEFAALAGAKGVWLALVHERAKGRTRFEGTVALHRVEIAAAE